MALNIPMPKFGSDIVATIPGEAQNILSKILQGQQRGQELAETAKYHQGTLDISRGNLAIARQAEARAQKLLPYIMQEYKDVHGKNMSALEMQNLYNGLIKDALSNNQPIPMAQPSQAQIPTQEEPTSVPYSPMRPMKEQTETGLPYTAINQQNIPGMEQYQTLMQPPSTLSVPQRAYDQLATQPTIEQNAEGEQIIRPGNPKLNNLDAIAGFPNSPIKSPSVQYDRKNGFIYTQYPSGKITRQKMEGTDEQGIPYRETPQQKEERMVNTAARIAAKKDEIAIERENRKEAVKIENSVDPIIKSSNLVNEAISILKKNPNITGMKNYLGKKTKLSKNEELARLDTIFGKIQAEMSKYAAARPGAQSLKWAENIKANIFNTNKYNLGMLEQMLTDSKNDYEYENQRYMQKVNKKLPVNFPGSKENNIVTVEKPDGTTINLPEAGAMQLVKDHPNHKIVSK